MSVSSWEPDPTGRHQYRWWDGEEWTDQVADDGVQSVDPVSAAEAGLLREALPPDPSSSGPDLGDSTAEMHTGSPDPLSMLSSRGQRFGAFLLEIPLIIVTLGIGYLIWSLVIYSRGQTPAKQLLKMRVVNLEKQWSASWLSMFTREWILKGALPIGLNFISWGFAGTLWMLIGAIMVLATAHYQSLWDKMLKTVVVNDPGNLFDPRRNGRNRPWHY